MLRVTGWRCVIVGGGAVALRRAKALADAGAHVVVIAPQIDPDLHDLAAELIERAYQSGDLADARLVVAATNSPAVNDAVTREARGFHPRALLNRADAPATPGTPGGDFTVMAHFRRGPLTVAVDTDNTSAAAAKAIREELAATLGDEWPTLLTEARPFRKQLQQRVDDPAQRTDRLRRLTDETARAVLRDRGVDALRRHLRAVAEGAAG